MTKLPLNFTYDLSNELEGQQLISSLYKTAHISAICGVGLITHIKVQ